MSFAKTLKAQCLDVWEDCYQHSFLQEMGQGTLDKETFMFYLKQDYRYLPEYAKVFAIGVTRCKDEKIMTNLTATQNAVLQEMDLHRSYMRTYGITDAEAEATKLSLFNKAYTANMVNVGFQEDLVALLVTVFPCAWTYHDFAARLKQDYAAGLENNYYKSWIETYASAEFRASYEWFYDAIDELCRHKTQSELDALVTIFHTSVEFEYLFWDMAYKRQMSY